MTVASPDEMRQYDALYEPFPPFAAWPRLPEHLAAQWDELTERLAELRAEATEEDFAAVHEEAMRAAAWDTGAIEGLYTTDRGFTITVATQAAGWEAQVRREKGDDALALFEAQLGAYRQAMDAATEATPISEAWIRHLHEVATAAQGKYTVHTAAGGQEHDLPKGQYKRYPNHILQADGRVFAHAPVADVAYEMGRLVEELSSEAFADGHPIEQASYAHYALVRIHPFADGNGRVARALASVFTLRATSIPLAIYADERSAYLGALEATDEGTASAFLRFVGRAVSETGRDAVAQLRQVLAQQDRGAGEKGSYAEFSAGAHAADAAAQALIAEAEAALNEALDASAPHGFRAWAWSDGASDDGGTDIAIPPGWRRPDPYDVLVAQVYSEQLSRSLAWAEFSVLVATDPRSADDLRLVSPHLDFADVGFAFHGVVPSLTQRSKARLRVWAGGVATQMNRLAVTRAAEAGGPTTGPGESAG